MAEERKGVVTFKGTPLTLVGPEIKPGQPAPDVTAADTSLQAVRLSDAGVMEVLGVTQMFSSYTKIADTLQLEPDMGDIAPIDDSPAPR